MTPIGGAVVFPVPALPCVPATGARHCADDTARVMARINTARVMARGGLVLRPSDAVRNVASAIGARAPGGPWMQRPPVHALVTARPLP